LPPRERISNRTEASIAKERPALRALACWNWRSPRRDQAIVTLQDANRAIQGPDRSIFFGIWPTSLIERRGYESKRPRPSEERSPNPSRLPERWIKSSSGLHLAASKWGRGARAFEQVRSRYWKFPGLIEQVDLQLGRCYENLNSRRLTGGLWPVVAREPESTPARAGLAAAQIALGLGDDALEQYRPSS